ncbi:MAG: enoyl-CoA hydratase/isomerase family protein [Clostridiales bacterium]|nr:enoyl-CoA hydratase/isomerase family protein [Clostridiales bacterium]
MDFVTVEVKDRIAIVTFSRPPINAVNLQSNIELAEAFEEINRRDDVECAILRAEGKGFMSGSDVEDFGGFNDRGLSDYEDADVRSILAVYNCRVPVICQTQGYVMGHGTTLAAAADFIVAADDTYFSLPEVTICVVGGTDAIRQLVPEKFLRYMAYTGKKIGVQKIAEFGQIHSVVPRAEALDEAMRLAHEITANYTKSVQCVKAAIQELTAHDKARDFYVDCTYTHELLKDPNRDAVLKEHFEMLERKRAEKAARKAKESKSE